MVLGRFQKCRNSSDFFLLFGIDDSSAHVMTAVGAGHMRRRCLAALGAGLQLSGGKSIVRPSLAGARIGVFAFRYGHGTARSLDW